jgi:glutamyl/glutaminyl-tRNA synthetase
MEDLDQVVSRRDLADRQMHDLAALGLDWDDPVVFQSDRTDQYVEALEVLKKLGLTYLCFCTRREITRARVVNSANTSNSASSTPADVRRYGSGLTRRS